MCIDLPCLFGGGVTSTLGSAAIGLGILLTFFLMAYVGFEIGRANPKK